MAPTRKTKKNRAGIYVRLSKEDLDGGNRSLAEQEEECRQAAKRAGLEVVEVFAEEPGTSGYSATAKRPEFDRAVKWLADGRIDSLVVWALDRLSRRGMGQVGLLLDELEARGGRVLSVSDGIDTADQHSRLIVALRAEMAREESHRTSQRIKRAFRADAAAGKPHMGGTKPFGWKKDKVTLDPAEAPVLAEAIRRVVEGDALNAICQDLRERGVRTAQGKVLRVQTLRNMILSPRPAGLRLHNGELHPGQWEPVVDVDTWKAAVARFGREVVVTDDGMHLVEVDGGTGKGRGNGPRHGARQALLTGLVRCGRCGDERMRQMRNKGRYVYECPACHGVTIGAEAAEEKAAKEVLEVVVGRRMVGHDTDVDDVAELEAEAEAVRERMRRLSVAHFVEDAISADEYEAARVPLAAALADLDARLVTAKEARAQVPAGGTREDLSDWWDGAAFADRQRVVQMVLDRVEVLPAMAEDGSRLKPAERLVLRYRESVVPTPKW